MKLERLLIVTAAPAFLLTSTGSGIMRADPLKSLLASSTEILSSAPGGIMTTGGLHLEALSRTSRKPP